MTSHFGELLDEYLSARCFRPDGAEHPRYPWQRPIDRAAALAALACPGEGGALVAPVGLDEQASARSLHLERVLLAIYEQDLAFLDAGLLDPEGRACFEAFYDADLVALGKALRPALEPAAFGFLEACVPPRWSGGAEALVAHMNAVVDACDAEPVGTVRFLRDAGVPALAARALIVQIAPDALSEASAMGRTLLGVFGEEQSALMRVFMDEYGLGVHRDKHGTLYERLMTTSGLGCASHRYYHHYLPTSLLMTNYFHYLCCDRRRWFRYLGALFYLEATMPHFAEELSPVLREVLGADVDTAYFDEHAHIDPYHKRLVLEDLVVASIRRYGDGILGDLFHGFEAIRVVQRLADEDWRAQVAFALEATRGEAAAAPPGGSVHVDGAPRLGAMEERDVVVTVLAGRARFDAVGFAPREVGPGFRARLPRGRLYSLSGPTAGFRAEWSAA